MKVSSLTVTRYVSLGGRLVSYSPAICVASHKLLLWNREKRAVSKHAIDGKGNSSAKLALSASDRLRTAATGSNRDVAHRTGRIVAEMRHLTGIWISEDLLAYSSPDFSSFVR